MWLDRQFGTLEPDEIITSPAAAVPEESGESDPEGLKPMRAAARRTAEALAGDTSGYLAKLVDVTPSGMALFDSEMRYLIANRRWKNAFGLEDDEIIGRSHQDIFLETSSDWEQLCLDCLEAGVPQAGSELVEWADGTREWVRWTMSPWRDDEAEHGLAITFDAIADPRVSIRKNLTAEEEDLASAFAHTSEAPVLVLDMDGTIVRSNRKARELGNWQPGKAGQGFAEVFLGKEDAVDFAERIEQFAQSAHGDGVFDFPAVSIEKVETEGESARRVAWHSFPRHAHDGSINGLIRVGIDAGELSAKTAAAGGSGDAEAWMDLMPQPFFRLRAEDGAILFSNRAWHGFRGAVEPDGEINLFEVVHEDDSERLAMAVADLRESGGRVNLPVRITTRDDENRWFRLIIDPGRFGNTGSRGELIGYCEDAAAQKHLEEELADLQARHDRLVEESESANVSRESIESDAATAKDELARLRADLAREKAARSELEAVAKSIEGKAPKAAEVAQKFQEKEAVLTNELGQMQDAIKSLRDENRKLGEERQRFASISESAPFGIVVLSRDGSTLYANPGHLGVVGSDIRKSGKFEEWLSAHCPDESPAATEKLAEAWREEVWRKQQTRIFPVRADDDSLRELEFRPKMLRDGQFLVSIFDVTDARRSEEALASSEARFRALFQDAGVPIALEDAEGKIYDANPALEKMLGHSRMNILRRGIRDFLAKKDAETQSLLLRELESSHSPTGSADVRLSPSSGEELPVEMQVALVRNVEGDLMFTAYFFRESRDRREARDESPKRPSMSLVPDTVVQIDQGGIVREWIAGAAPDAPWHSVQPNDAVGKSLRDLVPALGENFADSLASGRNTTRPVDYSFDEGGRKFSCRHVTDKKGNVVLTLCEAVAGPENQDPPAAKVDAAAQRQRQALLCMRDGIVITDLKGRITDINAGTEEMFGYSADEIIGKGLYTLYAPNDPKSFKQRFTTGISKFRKWEEQTEIARKDGSAGLCEALFVPMMDSNGKAIGLVGVNRALAEPRPSVPAEPAPAAIPVAAPAAAPGAGELNRLLANKRDSIEAIKTLMNLQKGSLKDAGALNALEASRLRVEALAILQKHEFATEGGLQVDFGKFVREFVQFLLEEIGPEETGIEVHLNVKNVVLAPETATPLALVLNELLCNSLKHAFKGREAGVIAIQAALDGSGGRLAVKDDGTGLPDWLQINESPGLGLQIVHALAEQLKGSIELGDELETEFRVNFEQAG